VARKKNTHHWIAIALGTVAVLAAAGWYWQSRPGSGYTVELGFAPLEHAYHDQRTDFMSEVSGAVVRIVVDEKGDAPHQKFFIRLENGQTVLVVHDLEAGGKIPLAINDRVTVRGEYSWSETGGTLQRTERDLSTQRRHGFVEHEGKRYQ
jgi:hypothetical protein